MMHQLLVDGRIRHVGPLFPRATGLRSSQGFHDRALEGTGARPAWSHSNYTARKRERERSSKAEAGRKYSELAFALYTAVLHRGGPDRFTDFAIHGRDDHEKVQTQRTSPHVAAIALHEIVQNERSESCCLL